MGTTVGGAGFSVSVSSAVDFRLEERDRMEGTAEARRATDAREERVEKALASMVVSVGWKGATVQIRRARAAWDRRGILATVVEGVAKRMDCGAAMLRQLGAVLMGSIHVPRYDDTSGRRREKVMHHRGRSDALG